MTITKEDVQAAKMEYEQVKKQTKQLLEEIGGPQVIAESFEKAIAVVEELQETRETVRAKFKAVDDKPTNEMESSIKETRLEELAKMAADHEAIRAIAAALTKSTKE